MSSIADISEILLMLGLSGSVTEEERSIAQESLRYATGAIIRHLKYDPVQKVRTEYYPQLDLSLRRDRAIWETTDNTAFLQRLTEAASTELQVQHIPVRETDENGDNEIDLRITFDGRSGTRANAFPVGDRQIEGDDFWGNYDSQDSNGIRICRDGILRSEGRWPSVTNSIKIVYTAGYTPSELHGQDSLIDASPILDAVLDEAVRRFLKVQSRRKHSASGFSGPFLSEKLGDYSYRTDTATLSRLVGGSFDILPETASKLTDFINYGYAMAS